MAAPDEPGQVQWQTKVGDRFERRVTFPWSMTGWATSAQLRREVESRAVAATLTLTLATTTLPDDTIVFALPANTLTPGSYVGDLELDPGTGAETWLEISMSAKLDVTRLATP